jgi:hypothetical protein
LPLEKIFMKIVQMTGGYKGLIWPHIQWILENTWSKVDVFYFIDDIILLMLKLVSNKIGTFLTSLWHQERHLSTVFRWILPIFRQGVEEIKHFCSRAPKKYFNRLSKLITHKYS